MAMTAAAPSSSRAAAPTLMQGDPHEGLLLSASPTTYPIPGYPPTPGRSAAGAGAGMEPISEAEDSQEGGDSDLDAADAAEMEQIGGGMLKEMVLKSGYLLKKGERRKNWKKRYFVLRPDRLCYYKDDREYQILRSMAISEVHACAQVEVKRYDNCFGIVTPKRTYYIRAQTQSELVDWVTQINQAKNEAQAQARLSADQADSNETTPLHTIASTPVPAPGESDPAQTQAGPSQASTAPVKNGATAFHATGPTAAKSMSAVPIPFAQSDTSRLAAPYPISSSVATTSSFSTSTSEASRDPDSYLSSSYASSSDAPSAFLPGSLTSGMGSLTLQTGDGQDLVAADGSLQKWPARRGPTAAETTSDTKAAGISGRGSGSRERTSYFPPQEALSSSEEEEQPFQDQSSAPAQSMATPLGAAPKPRQPGLQTQADPHRIVMSGYLMKGTKRKNWRKRWFTLTSQKLMYSRSHIDAKVNRDIPLDRILDVMECAPVAKSRNLTSQLSPSLVSGTSAGEHTGFSSGDSTKKVLPHCFKIITPSRTYLVSAPTEEDEIKWLSALRVLIDASRRPTHVQGDFSPPPPAAATDTSAANQGLSASPSKKGNLAGSAAPVSAAVSSAQQGIAATGATTAVLHGSNAVYPSIESKLEEASAGAQPRSPLDHRVTTPTRPRSATEAALGAIREVEKSFAANNTARPTP